MMITVQNHRKKSF